MSVVNVKKAHLNQRSIDNMGGSREFRLHGTEHEFLCSRDDRIQVAESVVCQKIWARRMP